jgi:hypothetical protein
MCFLWKQKQRKVGQQWFEVSKRIAVAQDAT